MAFHRLGEIAYARSGDKGAGSNIGVIAFSQAGYEFLRDHLQAADVERFFSGRDTGRVVRYESQNLGALNFVLPAILDGGGSVSLRIDAQGKALGQAILEMQLEVPDELLVSISAIRVAARRSGVL
ncbi:MAG TPA: hypothetical protein VFE47_28895 [Tepidisphaeraceae bacterium]|nr:hypothetical protein [Tepidisphaeraceae bacterium]